MGVKAATRLKISSVTKKFNRSSTTHFSNSSKNSMSQGFHQGFFGFPDGFERSTTNQSHRDKLRVHGFDGAGNQTLVPVDENEDQEAGIYCSANVSTNNILSEMFGFAAGPSGQIDVGQAPISGFATDWYGANRQGMLVSNESAMKNTGINPDPASAMQLFLMNPQSQRSPSSSPAGQPLGHLNEHTHSFAETSYGGGGAEVVEGQALSLTLSSSLQQYNMAKADDVGVREGLLYFSNHNQLHSEPQQHNSAHLEGVIQGRQPVVLGNYGNIGLMNMLRSSKYARPAQELLEEFCNVGRGKSKASRNGRSLNQNTNPSTTGGNSSPSSTKEAPSLSQAEKLEHQRKKTKLISMLDEVDRRYNHYCDQMQMVVNSFDSVMGSGAATPYTALAKRAMSRHFRCLKDAIVAQLKQTCELLGEKDGVSGSGITKGDTPRLRALDRNLRQQRAFHQMGMMDQEAWRPQRGLPERSVSILRAWLFEHFLHPYPSDADKHLLARQTGLSRNQVANWFINARVRLWKPMIEDMYQQEFKEDSDGPSEGNNQRPQSPTQQQEQRYETQAPPPETNPSTSSSSLHNHHHPPTMDLTRDGVGDDNVLVDFDALANTQGVDMYSYGTVTAMRFGGTTGDISLTLGLRQAGGNAPTDINRISARDFEFDNKDYC